MVLASDEQERAARSRARRLRGWASVLASACLALLSIAYDSGRSEAYTNSSLRGLPPCGNGMCDSADGETAANCSADCGCANGTCGALAPDGCYCDASCAGFGDCCPDVCAVCGNCLCGNGVCDTGSGEDGYSCVADCGCEAAMCAPQAAGGCYCDTTCLDFADCCADVCTACGLCTCGDGTCASGAGEDATSCPLDCGCSAIACGGQAPDGCFCGADCLVYGDCCPDSCSGCGVCASCGDGVLDADETCDDFNTTDGDCCSSSCVSEPGGAPCAGDGRACTADVCDGAGACLHPYTSSPDVCDTPAPVFALDPAATSDVRLDVRPSVASDGASTHVVVWHSVHPTGDARGRDSDIFFMRSTDTGTTWNAAAILNGDASVDRGGDARPRLAAGSSGRWIAVWMSTNTAGGNDFDIVRATSTDNGFAWSSPLALHSNALTDSGNDAIPDIATDGAGNWIAAWHSTSTLGGGVGPDPEILYVRSTDDGATWSALAPMNASAATDAGAADILVDVETDGAGHWVAVWSSKATLGGASGPDFDILGATSTDNGASWTAPAPVNSFAAGPASIDKFARLATDGAGRWVTVWASKDTLGGTIGTDFDILSSTSTDSGATWSSASALNSTAAGAAALDTFPSIASDGLGGWLVAWYSNDTLGGTIGSDDDVLGAFSYDGGTTWTAVRVLAANAAGDSGHDRFPAVVPLTGASGAWTVVWQSTDTLGNTIGADLDILVARASCDCAAR